MLRSSGLVYQEHVSRLALGMEAAPHLLWAPGYRLCTACPCCPLCLSMLSLTVSRHNCSGPFAWGGPLIPHEDIAQGLIGEDGSRCSLRDPARGTQTQACAMHGPHTLSLPWLPLSEEAQGHMQGDSGWGSASCGNGAGNRTGPPCAPRSEKQPARQREAGAPTPF